MSLKRERGRDRGRESNHIHQKATLTRGDNRCGLLVEQASEKNGMTKSEASGRIGEETLRNLLTANICFLASCPNHQQGIFKGTVMKCSRCKSASYCGVECQRASWKEHKLVCHPPEMIAKLML